MIYSVPHLYNNRIKLDFDNWKNTSTVWRARFSKGISKTYMDLCSKEGYDLKHIENMKTSLEEALKCEMM